MTSSVFLADTQNHVSFHLYDDCGADVVCDRQEPLLPLFQDFNGWILEYDRKRIEKTFSTLCRGRIPQAMGRRK